MVVVIDVKESGDVIFIEKVLKDIVVLRVVDIDS